MLKILLLITSLTIGSQVDISSAVVCKDKAALVEMTSLMQTHPDRVWPWANFLISEDICVQFHPPMRFKAVIESERLIDEDGDAVYIVRINPSNPPVYTLAWPGYNMAPE